MSRSILQSAPERARRSARRSSTRWGRWPSASGRRASARVAKASDASIAAQLEAAESYGVHFVSFEQDGGRTRVCYDGEAFLSRLLALAARATCAGARRAGADRSELRRSGARADGGARAHEVACRCARRDRPFAAIGPEVPEV